MTEFYQGWMIELALVETHFQFVCYSPGGQALRNSLFYTTHLEALQAAFHLVDQCLACSALRALLREWFEARTLESADWQALCQSLEYTARGQFIQSPSAPK